MDAEIINDPQTPKRKRFGGGRAFRSRLEPFVDFIREQRQHRKTWQEIAELLSTDKSCVITAQGVHQFFRRHLRRSAKGHWENESNQPVSQPARPTTAAKRPQPQSAPLPVQSSFKRPDASKLTTEQYHD
jgi:hypothetical protein